MALIGNKNRQSADSCFSFSFFLSISHSLISDYILLYARSFCFSHISLFCISDSIARRIKTVQTPFNSCISGAKFIRLTDHTVLNSRTCQFRNEALTVRKRFFAIDFKLINFTHYIWHAFNIKLAFRLYCV